MYKTDISRIYKMGLLTSPIGCLTSIIYIQHYLYVAFSKIGFSDNICIGLESANVEDEV